MKPLPERAGEQRISVTHNVGGYSMQPIHRVEDQFSDVLCSVSLLRGCQVHHAREMINDNANHVK